MTQLINKNTFDCYNYDNIETNYKLYNIVIDADNFVRIINIEQTNNGWYNDIYLTLKLQNPSSIMQIKNDTILLKTDNIVKTVDIIFDTITDGDSTICGICVINGSVNITQLFYIKQIIINAEIGNISNKNLSIITNNRDNKIQAIDKITDLTIDNN